MGVHVAEKKRSWWIARRRRKIRDNLGFVLIDDDTLMTDASKRMKAGRVDTMVSMFFVPTVSSRFVSDNFREGSRNASPRKQEVFSS